MIIRRWRALNDSHTEDDQMTVKHTATPVAKQEPAVALVDAAKVDRVRTRKRRLPETSSSSHPLKKLESSALEKAVNVEVEEAKSARTYENAVRMHASSKPAEPAVSLHSFFSCPQFLTGL